MRKIRRQLHELVIRNYPDRAIECALENVKLGKGRRGLLAMLTDEAVYELVMALGDDRRFTNRLNARNREIMAGHNTIQARHADWSMIAAE